MRAHTSPLMRYGRSSNTSSRDRDLPSAGIARRSESVRYKRVSVVYIIGLPGRGRRRDACLFSLSELVDLVDHATFGRDIARKPGIVTRLSEWYVHIVPWGCLGQTSPVLVCPERDVC